MLIRFQMILRKKIKMSDYNYKPDGKLHTRFTELTRCTLGQVKSVVDERMNGSQSFQNEAMWFGEARHKLWAEEAKKTGRSASSFSVLSYPATYIEKEFATEILPGIVVHSRPDLVSVPKEAVIDYKTLSAEYYNSGTEKAESYKASKQLLVYAVQLGIHNIRIKRLIYMVEIWNMKRDKILGYTYIEKNPTLADLAQVVPWIKDRTAILLTALKEAERYQNAGIQQAS